MIGLAVNEPCFNPSKYYDQAAFDYFMFPLKSMDTEKIGCYFDVRNECYNPSLVSASMLFFFTLV